ncbi:MAG: hypothetical protein DSZ24_05930 [Thermodesulfatator sp.]|nr:MAG: hypothetical protein DSZ24_05930 [Thermodesulfatator sp.]
MAKKRIAVVGVWLLLLAANGAFALNYQDFYPYFPDIPGFQAEKPSGVTLSTPYGTMTQVQRRYTSGPVTLEAQLMVGSMAQSVWFPLVMQSTYDTPEERLETTRIKGFPAKRLINKRDPRGTLTVLLSPQGQTPVALFILNYEGISPAKAQAYLEKYFKLKEIAAKVRP